MSDDCNNIFKDFILQVGAQRKQSKSGGKTVGSRFYHEPIISVKSPKTKRLITMSSKQYDENIANLQAV